MSGRAAPVTQAEAASNTQAVVPGDLGPVVQVDPPPDEKLLARKSTQLRPCTSDNPNCTPGSNTIGLAWDGSAFWASDRATDDNGIYRRDPATGDWERQFLWMGPRLGPITLDGSALWVVDEAIGAIFRIDTSSGRTLGRVAIPPTALHQPPAITGLTWDGGTLWLCTACGLCSAFYRVDAKNGQVLQTFYAGCEPRGLAFDGAYLWTLGYNGRATAPRLSRRRPADDPTAVLTSHTLVDLAPAEQSLYPCDPTALAPREDHLWVADRERRELIPLEAQRPKAPTREPVRTPRMRAGQSRRD